MPTRDPRPPLVAVAGVFLFLALPVRAADFWVAADGSEA